MIDAVKSPIFELLAQTVKETQMPAWVVGGYVRDYLLGHQDKDIDVVVLGSGIEFARAFHQKLGEGSTFAFFKNFGTAHIKHQDWVIEFIGARKESYRNDSRKPLVENGSMEDDANRRDFTINALSISLNPENFGQLLDPFNGIKDLNEGIIRTPLTPGITFSDDPLRMLRGIRFATRLGFKIEHETFEAIKENAHRISIVSAERISEELNKIILCKKPSIGFSLLFDTGLLQIIFPELAAMQGIETVNGKSHKDNFYHTLQVLDQLCELSNDLWLRWSAILHDIAKPATKRFDPKEGWTFHGHEDRGARMVKSIFRRLRLPLDEKMRFVEKMVALHLRPIVLGKEGVTDSAVRRLIVDAGEDLPALLLLCRADITSKNKEKVRKHLRNLDLVEEKIKDVEERDALRNWQPPITGEHILNAFHIPHPKMIGDLKGAVREAILEGWVPNELEAAHQWMVNKGIEMGLTPKNIPQ